MHEEMKYQSMKESNTVEYFAAMKELQRGVLKGIKGPFMKELNTLANIAAMLQLIR